jgi:hypothetical protein
MTPHEFIAKWRNGGDERRDWHSFFDDLCRLVGHPTPREADGMQLACNTARSRTSQVKRRESAE